MSVTQACCQGSRREVPAEGKEPANVCDGGSQIGALKALFAKGGGKVPVRRVPVLRKEKGPCSDACQR